MLTIGEPSTVPTSILSTPPTFEIEQTMQQTEVTDSPTSSNQLVSPSPSILLNEDEVEADAIETADLYASDEPPLLTASPSSQEDAEFNGLMDQMKNMLGIGAGKTPSFSPTTAESTVVPSLMPSNAALDIIQPAVSAVEAEEEPEEEETAFYENPAVIAGGVAATAAVGGAAFLAKGAMDGTGVLSSLFNKTPDAPNVEMKNNNKGNNKTQENKKNENKSENKEQDNKNDDGGDDDEFELELESSDEEKERPELEEGEERPKLVRQQSYRNVTLDPKLARKKKKSSGSTSTKKRSTGSSQQGRKTRSQ